MAFRKLSLNGSKGSYKVEGSGAVPIVAPAPVAPAAAPADDNGRALLLEECRQEKSRGDRFETLFLNEQEKNRNLVKELDRLSDRVRQMEEQGKEFKTRTEASLAESAAARGAVAAALSQPAPAPVNGRSGRGAPPNWIQEPNGAWRCRS